MYDTVIVNSIGKHLIERKQTIATAESVTVGHLQAALSVADNATHFFRGGITAYSIAQKFKHLQVDPVYALANNGVTQQIAETMAQQVCSLFDCDIGIGITGYATLIPGIDHLHAFFSIAHKHTVLYSGNIPSSYMESVQVQLYYTNEVLKQVLHTISDGIKI